MKWTGLNELREKYLSFFESKGHLRLPSYSLVPHNDKSLFLINSGMAPMKKYFLAQETPPCKRVTTCQKCIRTPDIENVGKTARHGTYFEMLGNFSFQDYFKHEATKWAWEFCTEVLDLPIDRLWVSIYLDDDEAFDIWTKEVGVDPTHIVRLGKEDNFWEHGSGPCGPCSEIYFDRGIEKGCGSPDCAVGCECDRFVEFWNLVFSQFDSDGNGTYTPLENPNIDTGMGLERLACIMQEVDNLFEVDTMQNIMKHISDIAGITYKDDVKADVSLRVITDHIRSTTFMIGDGVIPSNEGRGYVLRRLLRRAARHGRLLGITRPFLSEVVDTVINENKSAYPELMEKAQYIKKMVKNEEDSFAKTIEKGLDLLTTIIDNAKDKILSGEDAFRLYDTYGFPIDLTREIIAEKGMEVDEKEFTRLMNEQRERARAARATGDAFGGSCNVIDIEGVTTEFVGYETLQADAKVLALACEGECVESVIASQRVIIATDVTPFYAESGGQIADKGQIVSDNCIVNVFDVKKAGTLILHSCEVVSGQLNIGDQVSMRVDKKFRNAITRNHTCAHLLQAALINNLGDHVHQAGQLVTADRLRFDFSHFEALTREQIETIEREVNKVILAGIDVNRYETDIQSAKAKGAMALFGEKYGNIVRVCEVGNYSLELCGGTHVDNSAKIGLFKIISESSVAAGVRRIEAVTGYEVLVLLDNNVKMINDAAKELKLTNSAELVSRCSQVMQELKDKATEVDRLTQKMADSRVDGLFENVQSAGEVNYITALLSGTKPDTLRVLGDKIKEKAPNTVALLVSMVDNKGTMLCVCGPEAVNRGAHAGKIVGKAAAITGGKGGGRADNAMAGVNDNTKIDEAFVALESIIKEVIG
ncbi:alanine--tRNA ligase [Paludicola sp. MB14-C6]|uniref:alanine--tRNA ligase n=1 Tax=Paludihabitans sp. MB14-C6 TaxID=3070656 RepID=UPI0027DD0DB4|nr:alanine--tRNA ligase [Paludicola sp. MB14-C6]WMJ21978.1 alanine--tRNA ligase [Paludicola sp. MB14-C6]